LGQQPAAGVLQRGRSAVFSGMAVIAHGVGQAARIFWPVRERAIA
jgi:hypothetical protein